MPSTARACPHCGSENVAGRRICYHCRQPLVAVREPAQPASLPWTLPLMGFTLGKRLNWYHQLYRQLHSGIPLAETLDFLERNTFPFLRPVAHELSDHVHHGGMLSEAMERYPHLFPAWECGVVRAGEESGDLPEAIANIADSLEVEARLRAKINADTMMLKCVAVFLVFVAVALNNFRGGNTSSVVRAFLILGSSALTAGLILGVLFLIWLAFRLIARTRPGAEFFDGLLAHLPFVGPLQHAMCRQRFIRALQSLWQAGVSPMRMLEYAAGASGSPLIIHRATEQLPRLKQGDMLSEVIGDMRVLPEETIHMLRTGETAGRVAESLATVADHLRIDLDQKAFAFPQKVLMLFYAIVTVMVVLTIASMMANYGRGAY